MLAKLVAVHDTAEGIRISARVSDGPEGDAALAEATDHTRDGLSFDVVDAVIEGDEITDAEVIAIGQVGIPAYEDSRIDQIAASQTPTQGESTMTDEQRQRLAELRALPTLTQDEANELAQLAAMEASETAQATASAEPAAPQASTSSTSTPTPAAAPVTASVPSGLPRPQASGIIVGEGGNGSAFRAFVRRFTDALRERQNGGGTQAITAALSDITWGDNDSTEAPAWSGELFSGVAYEPQFLDLFNTGDLTSFSGAGWRFTKKLAIADYAGDKAAIPTDTITTESSTYEAARMAVGVDIDRKFFDFPNEGFVESLFRQVAESWTIKLDGKVESYVAANAVAASGVASQTSLLTAAAYAVRALKRLRIGKASWILVNDDDLMSIFDTTVDEVLAYLELWGIDPKNFKSSPDVAAGEVYAGVKAAATLRTLPGSPVRVEAQNLANGGVDEAFFGYWAIEEHATSGIAKVAFAAGE